MREKYQDQIELLFGIELGLQPHLAETHRNYLNEWPFDFVIGSSHVVHGKDPYYPAFYEGKEEAQAYREYFESILENLAVFDEMDVYGHIDYVVRYGPNKNQYYSYEAYRELLDEILKTLIRKNIGLELNTAGYKYGLGHPNPTEAVLKRYAELGGEILTIGSRRPCSGTAGLGFPENPLSSERMRFPVLYGIRGTNASLLPGGNILTKIPQTAAGLISGPSAGFFIKINIPLLLLLHPHECLTLVSSDLRS